VVVEGNGLQALHRSAAVPLRLTHYRPENLLTRGPRASRLDTVLIERRRTRRCPSQRQASLRQPTNFVAVDEALQVTPRAASALRALCRNEQRTDKRSGLVSEYRVQCLKRV